MKITTQRIAFSGDLLRRGFWVYIWKVIHKKGTYYYVGRTGDNSSVNAASPYSRISQHLDHKKSASANMLSRQLSTVGLDPTSCQFELTAFGPIYPEQKTRANHFRYRDMTAAIEKAVATYLESKNLHVLGIHPKAGRVNLKLLSKLKPQIERAL